MSSPAAQLRPRGGHESAATAGEWSRQAFPRAVPWPRPSTHCELRPPCPQRRTDRARDAIGRRPGSLAAAHPARPARRLPNRPGTRLRLLDVPAANRPPPRHRARAARRSGRRCRRRSTRWRSHDPCAGRNHRSPAPEAPRDPVTACPARPVQRCHARGRSRLWAAAGQRPCLPTRARQHGPVRRVGLCVAGIARPGPVLAPGRSGAHSVTGHRIRRIRNLTRTRRPSTGTSAGTRSWKE